MLDCAHDRDAKIRNTPEPMSEQEIINTANAIGKGVRDMMMENSGQRPEDIPLEDLSVKKMARLSKSQKNLDDLDK